MKMAIVRTRRCEAESFPDKMLISHSERSVLRPVLCSERRQCLQPELPDAARHTAAPLRSSSGGPAAFALSPPSLPRTLVTAFVCTNLSFTIYSFCSLCISFNFLFPASFHAKFWKKESPEMEMYKWVLGHFDFTLKWTGCGMFSLLQ